MSAPRGPDDGQIHVVSWGWPPAPARSGVPWIGIFLIVFGGLLLIQTVAPEVQWAGSILALAIGLAFLISWLINRRTSALYVGTVITALTLPDVLAAANVIDGGEGWGTLFLGIAFVVIAIVRAASRGGWGWQLVFGGLLVLIGGSTVAQHVAGFPEIGRYAWPIILVALGLILVARGSFRTRWS